MRGRRSGKKTNAVEAGTIPPPPAKGGGKAAKAVEAAPAVPPGWRKASDVLDSVIVKPTCLLDFNRATRVDGLALRRIHTVHGPTHGGKTFFHLALQRSFIDDGDVAGFIDAEHTTDYGFASTMMGAPLDKIPNFFAERPREYEETIEKVDGFLNWVIERKKNEPDLRSILVVDSINKLVPKRELTQLLKSTDNIDKGWGRYRAALNQAWLDHLTPLLAAADCALVLIAQEREDPNAEAWEMPKVKGGAALLFDASMIIRVSKGMPWWENPKDKAGSKVFGFQHRLRIWKSKVASMDTNHSDAVMFASNGSLTPPGIDFAREALHSARVLGLVSESGGWLTFGKTRWQGEVRAVKALAGNPEQLAGMLASINKKISERKAA